MLRIEREAASHALIENLENGWGLEKYVFCVYGITCGLMIHEIDFFPLCCAMSQPTHTLPYAGIIIVLIPLPDIVAPFYQHNKSK